MNNLTFNRSKPEINFLFMSDFEFYIKIKPGPYQSQMNLKILLDTIVDVLYLIAYLSAQTYVQKFLLKKL